MRGGIDLFWIPVGAGACAVRVNSRLYEGAAALVRRRPRRDLYHSALQVYAPGGRYVVEMTPVPDAPGAERGVVATGAVGSRAISRLRVFRYEVRCWRDGVIPDLAAAVGGPVRVTDDAAAAERLLAVAPEVPTAVWGRDELRAGDMWNSNSVVAWLLSRAGVPAGAFAPPPGGSAPGWQAGLVVAGRHRRAATPAATGPS